MSTRQPRALWLVRHGESVGNAARDQAEAGGLDLIDIAERDVDVPLSATGVEQAEAFGRWLAGVPQDRQPTVVLSSPYLRARQTAAYALDRAGGDLARLEVVVDERLREREFGVLDRLTRRGITERYPEQAELRRRLGKFWHRPPGGESWADVGLRLRSALDTVRLDYADERVLVVAHQVVILMSRYLLERMSEQQILAVDGEGDVVNCGLTSYERGTDGRLTLESYNHPLPLDEGGAEITAEPDVPAAPR